MKFNFKRIASIITGAVMLSSTVALAAATANQFPEPFVKSGTADVALVYGSSVSVAQTDIDSALQIAKKLNTYVVSAAVAPTTTTVTGDGDKTDVSSSSRRIYYGDSINAAKTSLSSSEMPTVLADGKVVDLKGTEYSYTQSIVLGDTTFAYGTSGGDITDPALYLDAGYSATDPIYNYTLSFNKNINVSDSTNVQGQKVKILGVDYVIGASSTNSTLYLYGAGATVNLNGGESKTVNVGGKDLKVEFAGATATTTGKITVDGVSKTVTKGSSYSFAGDVNVYVRDVTYQNYAGGMQSIELIVGANTLKLANGASVKAGADETTVKGTSAAVTAAGPGLISGFTVSVAAEKSQKDDIQIGKSLTDPVFGGLKVQFTDVTPGLNESSRAKVLVDTDNNQFAHVTFTSARAGTDGEQELVYVYDNNTASSAVQPLLAHQTLGTAQKGRIHVLEGELARIGDWIVVNQGDAGTILEVTDLSFDTATSGKVTFEDVITGEDIEVTLTNSSGIYAKTGVNFFGGNGYTINAPTDALVNISWAASGAVNVFPRVKLKDGGWIAFLEQAAVSTGSSVIFPTGDTTVSTTQTSVNATLASSVTVGGINWSISDASFTNATTTIKGINNPSCNFNNTKGPAILYLEPKKWNDNTAGNFICIPLTTTGTTEIAIGDPVFNGSNSGMITLDSDSYAKKGVDQYGVIVTKEDRTNENGVVSLSVPASQMYATVLFTADSVSQASTSNVTDTGLPQLKDNEVATKGANKNLIVVGGSCINTVAAQILGGSTATVCGEDFTKATKTKVGKDVGAGSYLIATFESPYNKDKVAMLVAGYNAPDTVAAATYVTTQNLSTAKGDAFVNGVKVTVSG